MIISDFSESTLKKFTDAKQGNIPVSDFVDALIESDFNKKDILLFVKKEFSYIYKYIKSYINN